MAPLTRDVVHRDVEVPDAQFRRVPGGLFRAVSYPRRRTGRHCRHRAVPYRGSQARYLHRQLHAARIQRLSSRRCRAHRVIHRDDQRRDAARCARGNRHGNGRKPDRRRAERQAGDGVEQRRPQGDPDRTQLQRAGPRGAGRRHQHERCGDGYRDDAVPDSPRPQQRGPHSAPPHRQLWGPASAGPGP